MKNLRKNPARLASGDDPRLPDSTSALPLRHWLFFFVLGAVPLATIINETPFSRFALIIGTTALAVLIAVLVNRTNPHVSKLRVVLSSSLGTLTYCLMTQLIVDLTMQESGSTFSSIMPMFGVFFLGVFAMAAVILALSAIT